MAFLAPLVVWTLALGWLAWKIAHTPANPHVYDL